MKKLYERFQSWRRVRMLKKLIQVLNEIAWAPYADPWEVNVAELHRRQAKLEKKLAKFY